MINTDQFKMLKTKASKDKEWRQQHIWHLKWFFCITVFSPSDNSLRYLLLFSYFYGSIGLFILGLFCYKPKSVLSFTSFRHRRPLPGEEHSASARTVTQCHVYSWLEVNWSDLCFCALAEAERDSGVLFWGEIRSASLLPAQNFLLLNRMEPKPFKATTPVKKKVLVQSSFWPTAN